MFFYQLLMCNGMTSYSLIHLMILNIQNDVEMWSKGLVCGVLSQQEEAPGAVCTLWNWRLWDSPGSSTLPTGVSQLTGILRITLSYLKWLHKCGCSFWEDDVNGQWFFKGKPQISWKEDDSLSLKSDSPSVSEAVFWQLYVFHMHPVSQSTFVFQADADILSCSVFVVNSSTILSISTCSRRSTCVLTHPVGDCSVCRSNCFVMQNTTQVHSIFVQPLLSALTVTSWGCSEYSLHVCDL